MKVVNQGVACMLAIVFMAGCNSGSKPKATTPKRVVAEPAAEGFLLEWKPTISLANKKSTVETAVLGALKEKLAPIAVVGSKETQPHSSLGQITVSCNAEWDAYGEGAAPTILDEESASLATHKLPRKLILTIKVEPASSGTSWDGEHVLTAERKNPEQLKSSGMANFYNLESEVLKSLCENLSNQIADFPAFTRAATTKSASGP